MYNHIQRDSEYTSRLKGFIREKYGIQATGVSPAKRGYYGETWRMDAGSDSYFLKLDYFPRHQGLFQNSLAVIEYLCDRGIDFIGGVMKTHDGELYSHFNSAVLGVFDWIDGENVETDATKIPEYQMLCKIYPLAKPGFGIPTARFTDDMATGFYKKWDQLQSPVALAMLEQHKQKFSHCAARLSHFAALCQKDTSDFYITHGDAGGNFFVGSNGQNYIVDWDEVMYAPLERDAWVMCCRDWARELFNETLRQNNIPYKLRPERLAFYCYHMFFLYLGEFLDDFTEHGIIKSMEDYLDDSFIDERIKFADML